MTGSTTIREIIRNARGRRNQNEFASMLGITQSTLSRYENGKVNPPADIIEQCMHLTNISSDKDAPTAEELANLILEKLSPPTFSSLRNLLVELINELSAHS